MSPKAVPGDPDFPYMTADTPEEFERVRRTPMTAPAEDPRGGGCGDCTPDGDGPCTNGCRPAGDRAQPAEEVLDDQLYLDGIRTENGEMVIDLHDAGQTLAHMALAMRTFWEGNASEGTNYVQTGVVHQGKTWNFVVYPAGKPTPHDLRRKAEVERDEALAALLDAQAAALPAHLRGDGPCMDCGTLNTPVWFAPNVLWNRVVGGPGTMDDPGGFLCPTCFIRRADAAGLYVAAWQLTPEWHWETHAERDARRALGGTA